MCLFCAWFLADPGVERPFYPGDPDEERNNFEMAQGGSNFGGVYGCLASF